MKIGIEAQRIFRPRKYGMDIVAIELIRHLQQIDCQNEYVVFVKPDIDISICETANFKIHYIKNDIYPLWEQILLPKAVKKEKIDFLHCTSSTAPLRLDIPLILTLHDVISLEPKEKMAMSFYQELGRIYRRRVIPKIVSRSKHIIAVSNTEKQHICDKLQVENDKISVVYNGVDSRFKPIHTDDVTAFLCKYQLPEYYIGFIGNTDPRKNLQHVLLAYSIYLEKSKSPMPLVILHYDKTKLHRLLKRLNMAHIFPNIRVLDYLAASDMPAFYSASSIFLFPSLREGFGMPVLESMACGTPVITSEISSMPEIAGDAALFVNPYHPEEIAESILYLENHPEKLQELSEKGKNRSAEFSWKKAASQVLDIYHKVYKACY